METKERPVLDRPVTRDDLMSLALHNSVLRASIQIHLAGLTTWEQAMETAAYLLAKENNQLVRQVIDLRLLTPAPVFIHGDE